MNTQKMRSVKERNCDPLNNHPNHHVDVRKDSHQMVADARLRPINPHFPLFLGTGLQLKQRRFDVFIGNFCSQFPPTRIGSRLEVDAQRPETSPLSIESGVNGRNTEKAAFDACAREGNVIDVLPCSSHDVAPDGLKFWVAVKCVNTEIGLQKSDLDTVTNNNNNTNNNVTVV